MEQYDEDLLLRLKSQGFGEHIESMKIWHNRKLSNPKQKTTTMEFQLRGNKQYADGEYRLALISYNKALCYAEKGSEDIGVLFANRSAVAFEMKSYFECLKNIQLARENNCPKVVKFLNSESRKVKFMEFISNILTSENTPEDLIPLLYGSIVDPYMIDCPDKTREEKCLDMILSKMSLENDPENLNNLLYGSIIDPYMIDCLEIVHNDNYPYQITKRDLMAGDIIAAEKPFVGVLMEHNLYTHCSNCMEECVLNLIPCDKCAFVMFCSEKCKNSGYQIHQYECEIIDDLISVFGFEYLFVHNHCRTLFKALSLFDGSEEELMKFVNETNKSSREMLTMDICNNEKSFLKAMYSLNNHMEGDIMVECCYSFYPKIKEMMMDREIRKFVTQLMTRFPRIIRSKISNGTKIYSGFSPLDSVLSLSCAPNVFISISNDSKIIYSTQYPIKAGEKLTIGNNCYFLNENKMQRQEKIFKTFEIKCDCVACAKNYPMINQLKIISPSSLFATKTRLEIAKTITGIEAFNMFKDNLKFINNNFDKYPCQEIAIAVQTNSLLLSKAGCSKTN